MMSVNLWCVTTVLIIKKAILSKSRSLKDRSHANKSLRKIKVNIGNKIGICISAYSNADVICYSATWQTKLNDVRLNVDRSWKLTKMHILRQWLVIWQNRWSTVVRVTSKYDDPRLKMSHLGCILVWHFQPRVHHIWMSHSLPCIIYILFACSLMDMQVSAAEWLAHLTAVWEDPGSNHTTDSCVYHDSCCDIQYWARAVHFYCSA